VREIQAFLLEMYAVDVSPDLISTVTDAVVAEDGVAIAAARSLVSGGLCRRAPREDPR
jgi:transposase-like protein